MSAAPKPWPKISINPEHFSNPPREYGILPFWFLNGELDPDEMRRQIAEYRAKGMPGIILHGRYGLEMPYIGDKYLERIRFAVEECKKVGLQTWIYDEMNWPSGTADKRVLKARPDLAQRYIECLNLTVRGPWFTYLTGADSRYIDFERSIPVAAFAVSLGGGDHAPRTVLDLTPYLSFENVIPWEAPAGNWRLIYIVEKQADYYIDALNPESTAEFLKVGYEPYARAVGENLSEQMLGFYTDEPAMHYYVTGGENPIVPWTKDMFRRFQERNGYNLRPRLPDLFFDINPESARVRYDFYTTLTEFYSQAYYQQIHEWCRANNVFFTGHLLYEEWLSKLIRVEGNLFKHYPHMDVIGVDHLYPIIGGRDRPDEHVAMKVGSSAAHQLRSPRLLCESFGGIFMDATMQRMKWIADWEYVLGVNLLNPHGFHYTLEGPRKRDWPPSMFYQYPWWSYYGEFSKYISRLSHLLSGGRHVAKVAMLWPLNGLFANFTPQSGSPYSDRLVGDFNALSDMLLRVHYDYDYLDEDILAGAQLSAGQVQVADEAYELIVLPPMTHIKLETLECLEQFVAQGGRVLGTTFLPACAFGPEGLTDISDRVARLFGVDPTETQRDYSKHTGLGLLEREHTGGGKTAFLRSYALSRHLPQRLLQQGADGRHFVIEADGSASRYYYAPPGIEREEITTEVNAERQQVTAAVQKALNGLVEPDITIDNPEIFYLHRVNDGQDVYFLVNSTSMEQEGVVAIRSKGQPVLWKPSTGEQQPLAPLTSRDGRVQFPLRLPPIGSAFVLVGPETGPRITATNLVIDRSSANQVTGYGPVSEGFVEVETPKGVVRRSQKASPALTPLVLQTGWQFEAKNQNALVIGRWMAKDEQPGQSDPAAYAAPTVDTRSWIEMVPGAWSYQLPAEPGQYPTPVWYRIPFHAETKPQKIDLIVDGFAGFEWKLYVNGQPVEAKPVNSAVDSQMKAVDITPYVQPGGNLIALRLVVTNATDGLLDLIKLLGDFRLESCPDGSYTIAAPRTGFEPASWTVQGYPFYSGMGVYRCTFNLPQSFAGQRVFVEPALFDDALEVRINGQSAGVRLWAPYGMEVTQLLKPGENTLELHVANTLINLLEATPRSSGLSAAPKLVAVPGFVFDIE